MKYAERGLPSPPKKIDGYKSTRHNSMYADNEKKFVAVLSRKVDVSQAMNVLAHLTAGLVAQCPDIGAMEFSPYLNGGRQLALLSRFPYIVLKAKNGNQIRHLWIAANEVGILNNCFVDTMLGTSMDAQQTRTRETEVNDLEYCGISLFGSSETLDVLTRKFSLYRVD